jgi:hypothetical protein
MFDSFSVRPQFSPRPIRSGTHVDLNSPATDGHGDPNPLSTPGHSFHHSNSLRAHDAARAKHAA